MCVCLYLVYPTRLTQLQMHMIYLGVMTGRIPIVPPIIPVAHITYNAGLLRFGSVFNLTTLRSALRRPVLEWSDVKTFDINGTFTEEMDHNKPTDPNIEYFGCWSVVSRQSDGPGLVQGIENTLKIDMSFTRVPEFTYFLNDRNNPFTTFSALSALIVPKYGWFNDGPQKDKWPPTMRPSRSGKTLHPDEQLACFDFMYYVTSGVQEMEFEKRWSHTWHTVGKHLRFTEPLVDLAQEYIRRVMKVEEIPQMIAVHIRRGDFKFPCEEGETPPCYIPLPKYRDAVLKMQAQLLKNHNVNASRVLVASDETAPEFWQQITDYGWDYFNHTAERTAERHDEWYPLLIDKVALSMGAGFVGTIASTFSFLNAWRVEDWNGGLSYMATPW
ncbi:hypothetical protein EST38_g11355 [Candolleomyces aberdarensis]|uniref:O-fucosyltransferase family protein n=1 Tax=Candolleomyces aberdarensis TaxID=2316362 RepID=A0A4Q2D540_9AGAR|nr:hypothetical protein EST38_g11355 [Candolleomyces aberdarensis]